MSRYTEVFAVWVIAVGTIFEAISSTQRFKLSEDQRDNLEIVGVALQTAGDVIIVDLIEDNAQEKAGAGLLAIGNVTILQGLLRQVPEDEEIVLNIKGNAIQALGASLILTDLLPIEYSKAYILGFYGLFIEIIGNVLQIIAGKKELNGRDGAELDTAGAWVQALGAVLGAIGLEIEVKEFDEEKSHNEISIDIVY